MECSITMLDGDSTERCRQIIWQRHAKFIWGGHTIHSNSDSGSSSTRAPVSGCYACSVLFPPSFGAVL